MKKKKEVKGYYSELDSQIDGRETLELLVDLLSDYSKFTLDIVPSAKQEMYGSIMAAGWVDMIERSVIKGKKRVFTVTSTETHEEVIK